EWAVEFRDARKAADRVPLEILCLNLSSSVCVLLSQLVSLVLQRKRLVVPGLQHEESPLAYLFPENIAVDSAVQVQLCRSLRLLSACLPVHRLQTAVCRRPDSIDEPAHRNASLADRERQLQRRHASRISPDAPRLSRSPLDIPGHLLNADC